MRQVNILVYAIILGIFLVAQGAFAQTESPNVVLVTSTVLPGENTTVIVQLAPPNASVTLMCTSTSGQRCDVENACTTDSTGRCEYHFQTGGIEQNYTLAASINGLLSNYRTITAYSPERCLDSDGGKNYFVKGNSEGWGGSGLITYTKGMDVCIDGNRLEEHYCTDSADGRRWNFFENYECPYGCSEGACKGGDNIVTCVDSDGGKNYNVKGYTKGTLVITATNQTEPYQWIDSCCEYVVNPDGSSSCSNKGYTTGYLAEYYCRSDDTPFADGYKCPNGCKDGACITTAGPVCGNNICELYEADEPGGCGPDADPRCLGPPARIGTCPNDCTTAKIHVYTESDLHALVGQDFLAQFTTKGGTEPYSWSVDGTLPPGLELVRPNIVCITTPCPQQTYYVYVKGSPTQAGEYKFRLTVKDANGLTGGETFVIGVRGDTNSINFNEKFELTSGKTVTIAGTDIQIGLNAVSNACSVPIERYATNTVPAATGGGSGVTSGGVEGSSGVATAATGAITGDTVCPAVCVSMWKISEGTCIFNSCGSGCGPDKERTFATEDECRARINTTNICPPVAMPLCVQGYELSKSVDDHGCVHVSCVRPQACTMELKICPDGTGVGRTGPNCEFEPCPTCGEMASITVTAPGASDTRRMKEGQQEAFGKIKLQLIDIRRDPSYGDSVLLVAMKNDFVARQMISTDKQRYVVGDTVKIRVYGPNSDKTEMTAIIYKPDGTKETVTLVKSNTPLATMPQAMTNPITGKVTAEASSVAIKESIIYNGVVFTGEYKAEMHGDYKVALDGTDASAKFFVLDRALLEKYLILSDIGGYKFMMADVSSLTSDKIRSVAYTALYNSSTGMAAAGVTEVNGREDAKNMLEELRKKTGSYAYESSGVKIDISVEEKEVSGNKVFAISTGTLTMTYWTHGNFVIQVIGMNYPNAVGISTHADVSAVIDAYLHKYPSDLGVEIKEKEVKSDELIDVAFRFENLKIKFDKLQKNALSLSDYYKMKGDVEAADKFQNVADMFGKAESMIEDMKTKTRENIDNPAIITELREDFKSLKDYVRTILLTMLGADEGADNNG